MPADDATVGRCVGRAEALKQLISLDERAPRYTSYPTALDFSDAVGEPEYRQWLQTLPTDEPVSLYAHVPFCQTLCWYCGCNTRAVRNPEIISKYVSLLVREIEMVGRSLPGRLSSGALHLGGGTPNMLGEADLDVLFSALRRTFAIHDGADISVEIDPAVLTEDWVRAAARHGLSRASLGVQDLSPAVQAAVNRIEPFEVIQRAAGWLRRAGVRSLNFDLMYGLPLQGVAEVQATLDQILTLRPERLALFGYAHVPWARAHQRLIDETQLAGAEDRLEQSEAAAERLKAEGYVRIGLDHYAVPEDTLAVALAEHRLHRNFQGYTTDPHTTLLAFGVSAIGRLPQGYVQNFVAETEWRAAVAADRLPVRKGLALTDEDRLRAEVIETLMCDLAVDAGVICRRRGRPEDHLDSALATLAPLVDAGVARVRDRRVEITPVGRPFLRTVAKAFDARSQPGGGFSKAI